MNKLFAKTDFQNSDLMASVVVFLVALPLCLGIAVASGAPPIAGLVGGIVGGIVVGWFGGSPLQVSGPANGLIVISFGFLATHGFDALLWATLLAGAIQLLAGCLRFGQLFRAVTPGVILGLMAGFAVVIGFGQAHVLLGSEPVGNTWDNITGLATSLEEVLTGKAHVLTGVVGLITFAIIMSYERFAPKSWRFVPAALVAVVGGSIAAELLGAQAARISLPGNLLAGLHTLDWLNWKFVANPEVVETALLIAFIASAETLLCCTAVDRLHNGPRTQYNRELAAQGAGNMLCGLLGGLPITGVIIRSSANIAAGGRSKWSTILHGFWLLLAVMMFSALLSKIPMAVLAAVLIHAVSKLVKPEQIRSLWHQDRFGVVVFVVTAAGIVSMGVMEGVIAGLVLSTLRLLKTFNALEIEVDASETKRTRLSIRGSATFLRIPYIASKLEQIERGTKVQVDASGLIHVDSAVYGMLRDWQMQHVASGGEVSPEIDELVARIGTDNLGPKKAKKATAVGDFARAQS